MKNQTTQEWTHVLTSKSKWFDLRLAEVWTYRDLLLLLVRRDFVALYKQTILGPLWYLISPIASSLVFTVIFGNVAKIPTNGIPPFLFYFAGLTCWTYFTKCLTETSNTFIVNASVFGKVYFPRLVSPLSVVISSAFHFCVQFTVFLLLLIYYKGIGSSVTISPWAVLFPLLIVQLALTGLGIGLIVSSLTTKYRDLMHLVAFGVQALLYATPVIYPASEVPARFLDLYLLNPVAVVIESFRYLFLGIGIVSPAYATISIGITLSFLILGIAFFNQAERTFMDTI